MYRDDDAARSARASSLIDEIADLERKKLEQATTEQRLEAAKRELSALQTTAPAPVVPDKPPSFMTHVVVFGATAGAAYLGYMLLI